MPHMHIVYTYTVHVFVHTLIQGMVTCLTWETMHTLYRSLQAVTQEVRTIWTKYYKREAYAGENV